MRRILPIVYLKEEILLDLEGDYKRASAYGWNVGNNVELCRPPGSSEQLAR